jgi:hypothetical protein
VFPSHFIISWVSLILSISPQAIKYAL